MKFSYRLIIVLQLFATALFAQVDVQQLNYKQPITIASEETEVFHILDESVSLKNAILEFDMTPLNSHGHIGAIIRHSSKESWIYVGCDMSDDIYGRAVWFITTPDTSVVFAKDINKPFSDIKRHIRLKYLENTLTLWVEGEEVIHKEFPCKVSQKPGKVGFRVWNGGSVKIENINYKACEHLVSENKTDEPFTISSKSMEVTLDSQFPRVISYKWLRNSSMLCGQAQAFNYLTINGKNYKPEVKISNTSKESVEYTLNVKEVDVKVTLEITVDDKVLSLIMTEIKENGTHKVQTIGFPRNSLVSVLNNQTDASLSVAKYSEDYPNNNIRNSQAKQEEFFLSLKDKQATPTNLSAGFIFLNTNELVATIDNNVTQNFRQFRYQSTLFNGNIYTGIWSQDWIYRGFDGKVTELPWAKIYISDDRNNDSKIDWQDGAIALRENMPDLVGAEKLRNSFSHIGKIEGSMVQYTFLRWLDYLKKINLYTDGFGQIFLIKGYQSEGHDSAHPDYAGNYNKRAGGYKDLQVLLKEAKKYNAELCLHINHSEAYPEAKNYSKTIVSDIPAWQWWDQSYFIIRKPDILNGTFQQRLKELNKQLPDLKFVYVDTYREERWIAEYTAQLLQKMGWAIYTEDNIIFDRYASWVHWSPGGTSKISRFIHHQNKDAYKYDPLLFGGYDSRHYDMLSDMGNLLDNFMTNQLPYRYLMHFPLMKWTESKALFSSQVQSQVEGDETVIRKNGKAIVIGKDIFIPWNPENETKIYCYNHSGKFHNWELPDSWENHKQVFLYELTDLGRKFVKIVPVIQSKVKLELKQNTPYVVYKSKTEKEQTVAWGEGSLVKDMGFDGKNFSSWRKASDSHAMISTAKNGNSYLSIEGINAAVVSQEITGLEAGKNYIASVWVEVSGDKKAILSILPATSKEYSNYMFQGGVPCTVPSQKRGNWQKMRVVFKMPMNQKSATLFLKAEKGNAKSFARFDDVRIIPFEGKIREGSVFFEDFENVDEGVYPFIPANTGTKIHLAERHEGYTKDVINGNFSMKISAGNGNGLVAQTLPCNLRFQLHTKHTISFSYKSNLPESYRIVVKSRKGGDETIVLDELLGKEGKFRQTFKTGDESDYYISIYKQKKSELIVDDLLIE